MSVSGLRSTLPPLSAEEERHSRALAAHTRAELLGALAALGVTLERYAILEVSADLAERQRRSLARLPQALRERVVWLERLPETPLEGVIIANEVADALPCRRFRWHGGKLRELGVALAEQGAAGEEAI